MPSEKRLSKGCRKHSKLAHLASWQMTCSNLESIIVGVRVCAYKDHFSDVSFPPEVIFIVPDKGIRVALIYDNSDSFAQKHILWVLIGIAFVRQFKWVPTRYIFVQK